MMDGARTGGRFVKAAPPLRLRCTLAIVFVALLVSAFAALPAVAQTTTQTPVLQPRITNPIDNSSRATLTGSRSPVANPADDIGAVSPSMKLQGISLVFSYSAAQQLALNTLIAAQQNPSSPLYHQWLTPGQFAAQFGVADADISAAESWLERQGFSIDSVSRSRNRIFFSGTAAQVASAFEAPLHNYRMPAIGDQAATTHFAPSADLTIPSALASSVLAIGNLSDFRPHSQLKLQPAQARPLFTIQGTQGYILTPPDVETIYDVKPAISQGLNGSGQTIAIVGQSAVVTSDITTFQTLLGLPAKAPTTVLVPGTGTSALVEGDETEADIDLEYSSSIAPGATVNFYYTGNNLNSDVLDAVQYVVDNDLAPIISISFGSCEFASGAMNIASFDATVLEQAAAQGETVLSADGDTGSTGCDEEPELPAQQTALAVSYPASSPFVTAMGGTEFPAADVTPPNTTFWASAPNGDVVSTALSYIPEQVWNDTVFLNNNSFFEVSAGGGGISLYEPLPAYQANVPGIPAGATNRLVPDISLAASAVFPGYLFCSSDPSSWETGQTASCPGGFFYQVVNGDLAYNVAGGTSFVAPTFAGMLAIINQAKGYTTGQGIINSTLYSLASNPTTYASAFHDITSGGNECPVAAGVGICGTGDQNTDYAAGTGYDEASGLGSIDFNNLLMAWPVSTGSASPISSSTTLTVTTLTPANGAYDTITIAVASASSAGTFVPFGSVSVSVNGTVVNGDLALANGMATYTFSSTTAGSATITATYSGDANYSPSTGTATLTVGSVTPGSFALGAVNATAAPGASTTGMITLTPANGYAGTVNLAVTGTPMNGCISISPTSVVVTTGTSAVTASYTVNTSSTGCASGAAVITGKGQKTASLNPAPHQPNSPWKQLPIPAALAGTFLLVCSRHRSRLLRAGMALGLLLVVSFSGLGLGGCSGGSAPMSSTPINTTTDTPAGTYTITVTGTDSTASTITASTTFTITVS
jgi:subtilase family serine protease